MKNEFVVKRSLSKNIVTLIFWFIGSIVTFMQLSQKLEIKYGVILCFFIYMMINTMITMKKPALIINPDGLTVFGRLIPNKKFIHWSRITKIYYKASVGRYHRHDLMAVDFVSETSIDNTEYSSVRLNDLNYSVEKIIDEIASVCNSNVQIDIESFKPEKRTQEISKVTNKVLFIYIISTLVILLIFWLMTINLRL